MDTKISEVAKALLSQSVADGVGETFEFNRSPVPAQVLEQYRTGSISITDDTQMTLFVAEGLMEGDSVDSYQAALHRWYRTQTQRFKSGGPGLLAFENLWESHAPGSTCMGALAVQQSIPTDGAGFVMRALPCLWSQNPCQSIRKQALLTHSGSSVVRVCDKWLDAMVAARQGVSNLHKMFPRETGHHSIESLGQGWVGWEAVDMAIWAAANAQTYEDLLVLSICHKGDSDTVGAMAGVLWGLDPNSEIPYTKGIRQLPALKMIIEALEKHNEHLGQTQG